MARDVTKYVLNSLPASKYYQDTEGNIKRK